MPINPLEICLASDHINFAQNLKILASLNIGQIELCASMDVGGLTPNIAHIEMAKQLCPNANLMCMIRPRAGGFVYDKNEIEVMKRQIILSGQHGADGVVFGVINEKRELHLAVTQSLVALAKHLNLKVTFHRAFDALVKPEGQVAQLTALGVDNILTAGIAWQQQGSIIEGLSNIERYLSLIKEPTNLIVSGALTINNVKATLHALKPYTGRFMLHSHSGVLTHGLIDAAKVYTLSEPLK